MAKVSDHIVLVTGAGAGIGAATARCYASEGVVFAAVAELPEDFKDISILVNNAGVGPGLEPPHKAQLGDWEAIVDTNIKGVLYCTRAILPGMVER